MRRAVVPAALWTLSTTCMDTLAAWVQASRASLVVSGPGASAPASSSSATSSIASIRKARAARRDASPSPTRYWAMGFSRRVDAVNSGILSWARSQKALSAPRATPMATAALLKESRSATGMRNTGLG